MRGLEPAERARVHAEARERAVGAGAFLCRRGEPVEHWFGMITGLAKMTVETPTGRPVSFTGLPAGAWFGEGSLLKSEPRRYDVVALRASRVALVPRATFHALLDSSIAFNRYVLHQLNERLAQFIGLVESARQREPEARVARALALLYNAQLYPGIERRLALSQEEIGKLAGLSRQRANRALRALEAAGLLRRAYGNVTVLDPEELRRYVGGRRPGSPSAEPAGARAGAERNP